MAHNSLCDNVPLDTWKVAQKWEREHWVRNQSRLAKHGKNYIWRLMSLFGVVEKYRGNDRNYWWKEAFDHYEFLPATVDSALEVGCGPYSNLRLIRDVCKPHQVHLSDPLIKTYVQFKMTYVSELHKVAPSCLDDHPLEELPFSDDRFGLVVMINVLDHVFDARLCMNNVIRVVRPGGYLIIGQDLTNLDDCEKQPDGLRTGHPITLDAEWFAPYLSGFEVLRNKIVPRDAGWAPDWHYGTLVFAGRKLTAK